MAQAMFIFLLSEHVTFIGKPSKSRFGHLLHLIFFFTTTHIPFLNDFSYMVQYNIFANCYYQLINLMDPFSPHQDESYLGLWCNNPEGTKKLLKRTWVLPDSGHKWFKRHFLSVSQKAMVPLLATQTCMIHQFSGDEPPRRSNLAGRYSSFSIVLTLMWS